MAPDGCPFPVYSVVRHGNHFAFALVVFDNQFHGSITAIARGAFSLRSSRMQDPVTPSQWCCPAWSHQCVCRITNRSRSVTTTTQTRNGRHTGSSQPSTCLSVTSRFSLRLESQCIPDSGARIRTGAGEQECDVVQYPVVQTTVVLELKRTRECVIPSSASLMQWVKSYIGRCTTCCQSGGVQQT